MPQTPDTKPGAYYVTAVDGRRVAFLLGPFVNDHATALGLVDTARREAQERDPRGFWYAYGTCRHDGDGNLPEGKLNYLMED